MVASSVLGMVMDLYNWPKIIILKICLMDYLLNLVHGPWGESMNRGTIQIVTLVIILNYIQM